MDKPINPFDFFHKREQYEIQRAMRRLDGTQDALATYEEFLKQEQDELIQKAIRQDVAIARDRIAVKKQVKKVLSTRAVTNGSKGGNNRALKTKPLKDWAVAQTTKQDENPHEKAKRLMKTVPVAFAEGIKRPQYVMYLAIRAAITKK